MALLPGASFSSSISPTMSAPIVVSALTSLARCRSNSTGAWRPREVGNPPAAASWCVPLPLKKLSTLKEATLMCRRPPQVSLDVDLRR